MNSQLFRSAVTYAYDHIDEPFSIDQLAAALKTSRDTLEREFKRVADTSPASLIRRLRAELAFRTLQDKTQSVIQVALAAGYSDHSAFSRSFHNMFGFPPSSARSRTVIQRDLVHVELAEPDIVELRALELQSVTEAGSYFSGPTRAWATLEEAVCSARLDPADVPLWVGQALDDPHHENVAPEQVRFCAGIECQSDLGLPRILLPEASYARFVFTGKPDSLGLAYHYIYGVWRERTNWALAPKAALILFNSPPASSSIGEVSICVPLSTV